MKRLYCWKDCYARAGINIPRKIVSDLIYERFIPNDSIMNSYLSISFFFDSNHRDPIVYYYAPSHCLHDCIWCPTRTHHKSFYFICLPSQLFGQGVWSCWACSVFAFQHSQAEWINRLFYYNSIRLFAQTYSLIDLPTTHGVFVPGDDPFALPKPMEEEKQPAAVTHIREVLFCNML